MFMFDSYKIGFWGVNFTQTFLSGNFRIFSYSVKIEKASFCFPFKAKLICFSFNLK